MLEVINRWAPPCENNTGACAARVRDALDVETGEEIDPDNLETLIVLAESIIISENGKQPYPPETIKAGALLALGRGAEIPPAQDVRSISTRLRDIQWLINEAQSEFAKLRQEIESKGTSI